MDRLWKLLVKLIGKLFRLALFLSAFCLYIALKLLAMLFTATADGLKLLITTKKII